LLLLIPVGEDEELVTNRKVLSSFPDLFIIAHYAYDVKDYARVIFALLKVPSFPLTLILKFVSLVSSKLIC